MSSEHAEQVTLINWFRRKYPDVLIFAIPNGGFRHISVAKQLKAEGVVKGVPDLFIPEWKTFIEMKRKKGGRLSKEQKEIISELERIGYKVIVANGYKEAIDKLSCI